MKKYLADALTFARFVCVGVLIALIVRRQPAEMALLTFAVGELTDAFDGICARKWPFPPEKTPKYRRFAGLYDMVSDVTLGIAALCYIAVCINWEIGLSILAAALVIGGVIEIVVYGKFFGAPTDCKPWALFATNPELATRIVLFRRVKLYLGVIAMVIVLMLFSTSWALLTKITILGIGLIVGALLWEGKKDRRTEVKTK